MTSPTLDEVSAAIAALPGKTILPWRDGDERCHCSHCELCGDLFRTSEYTQHTAECRAALLKALTPPAAASPAQLSDAIDQLSRAIYTGQRSAKKLAAQNALEVVRQHLEQPRPELEPGKQVPGSYEEFREKCLERIAVARGDDGHFANLYYADVYHLLSIVERARTALDAAFAYNGLFERAHEQIGKP